MVVCKMSRISLFLWVASILVLSNFVATVVCTSDSSDNDISHQVKKDISSIVGDKEGKQSGWEDGDYDFDIDEDAVWDTIGVSKTVFIVIVVVVCLLPIIIAIVCCVACGCLCFHGCRKKKAPTVINQIPQQQQGQQVHLHNQNYQGVYPTQQQQQPYPGYNNNGPNDNNGQGKPYYNAGVIAPYSATSSQKGASPPRQLAQPQQQQQPPLPNRNYSMEQQAQPRYDQLGQHPGDPNLIPNRFKPTVPAKPGRMPGWTAVTAEVKIRNQLQNNPYVAPTTPTPPTPTPQNQFSGYPPSPPHPQAYQNDAYDGGSLPQSPAMQSKQNNYGFNGPPPPMTSPYNNNRSNDNFMY